MIKVAKTLNSPKEAIIGDSFYVLGMSNVSVPKQGSELEQELHGLLGQNSIDDQNKVRDELLKRGLLPSQRHHPNVPPIVMLSTGDILIQEPELYKPEVLEQLIDWDHGKVVLMANGANPKSVRIKELVLHGKNKNLIAISPEGQLYTIDGYFDYGRPLKEAKHENEIKLANAEVASKIQLLRAVQEVLILKDMINEDQLGKETLASSDNQKTADQESIAVDDQRVSSGTYTNDLTALGKSPSSVAGSFPPPREAFRKPDEIKEKKSKHKKSKSPCKVT